ncbi:murein biosynthesis integral membrane protein MurJ [Candidatus Gracilibacteria bacterium]|nr:murein biosynthesis integral membrane protein MurJ [Candidatus Gracilibacteria bacterium]
MSKKFFKPIKVGGATALIAITSLFSYAIGLFRDRIIATNFGTSSITDAYNASFLIPDMLFNLFIAGALSAAFLPVFSEYLTKDKEEARKLANTMLTTATILITVLATIAFIFMPSIISSLFPETTNIAQSDIINMTRLMLGSAILFAISNTLGNILMSYKHFLAYALSPIFYNLGIILGVIFLQEEYGIYSAAIGVVVGASLHCIIRIIDTASTGYRFRPQLDIKHPGFKKILKLMLPKSISLIAWQVNLYIFAVIGMRMIEGSFSAFQFARNIQSFAVSIFGIAFATAVFPSLATAFAKKEKKAYTAHIQKTIQRILFFTIPAAVGIMILSPELVSLILEGQAFDEKSVELTSLLLFFFALSIPFESLVHILARAFYAAQNTFTPMLINLTAMAIIALTTIYATPIYGIKMFTIGFSIAFIIQVTLLLTFLKPNLQEFNTRALISSLAKTIVASGIMAIVVLVTKEFLSANRLSYVIEICAGGASFFLIAFLLKSPEISSVSYILKRITKKSGKNTQS